LHTLEDEGDLPCKYSSCADIYGSVVRTNSQLNDDMLIRLQGV